MLQLRQMHDIYYVTVFIGKIEMSLVQKIYGVDYHVSCCE